MVQDGYARAGYLQTPHGGVETPFFMTVGTNATVKGILPSQLRASRAPVVLGNTYHLALRPGEKIVSRFGGLAKFMNWHGPTLTDSGGYQVFSLAERRTLSQEGVRFKSHIDGSELFLTPERAVDIQRSIGADMMMVLDVCPPGKASREEIQRAMDLTHTWAKRALSRWGENPNAEATGFAQRLFAIVQGGIHEDLRKESAETLTTMDFPGFAIGGVAVGEPPEEISRIAAFTAALLPKEKPRYLMGVGRPQDIVNAVYGGVDMFDCVLPTRHARHWQAFTRKGPINLKNARFKEDEKPLDETCDCDTCRQAISRGYLRHLAIEDEMTGIIYLTLHNVRFYIRLMEDIRKAICSGTFSEWRTAFLTNISEEKENKG